jgi:hypothetical protein
MLFDEGNGWRFAIATRHPGRAEPVFYRLDWDEPPASAWREAPTRPRGVSVFTLANVRHIDPGDVISEELACLPLAPSNGMIAAYIRVARGISK